jgi:hypothetical protein
VSNPEIVPPSDEPDAAVGTGSGRDAQAATRPPDNSASTSGLGTHDEQQGASAKGGAAYQLSGSDDDGPPRSPSGT